MHVPYKPPPLKFRSVGDPVFAVKRALQKAGFARGLFLNKVFGAKTVLNVRAFQKANHLTVDGQVGPVTLKALEVFFDDYGYFLYTGRVPESPNTLVLPLVLREPTHPTSGLSGFPANDIFRVRGTKVIVDADCTLMAPHFIVWDLTKRVGGWTCYLWYPLQRKTAFITHLGMVVKEGEYRSGAAIGTIGAVPHGWWEAHAHYALHDGLYDPRV